MAISLDKSSEAAEEVVVSIIKEEAAKGNDLGEIAAQVVAAVDISGSIKPLIESGELGDAISRSLGLAMPLDDDQKVPVFFFHNLAFDPVEVNPTNYTTFLADFLKDKQLGATNYAGTIQKILESIPEDTEKDQPPTLVLFYTDGEPSDKEQTKKLLVDAASRPVFWMFIGLGGYDPTFLKELDTMTGRVIDNVGLVQFRDSKTMSDPEFYTAITKEWLTQWLPEARKQSITNK